MIARPVKEEVTSTMTFHSSLKYPLMKCGHAANAVCNAKGGVKYDPPIPSCAICSCIDIAPEFLDGEGSLVERKARCCTQASERDSSLDLAFFEYRGPGSRSALLSCKNCGYYEIAHQKEGHKQSCNHFEPHGSWEYDRYYCGCRGWN